jgi:hypothetical protein
MYGEGRRSRWGTATIHSTKDRFLSRTRSFCWYHSHGCYPYYYELCFLAMQASIDKGFFTVQSPNSNLPNITLQVIRSDI